MSKHRHSFTRLVEDGVAGPLWWWWWCIRCGALRLQGQIFLPGPKQTMVIK